MTPPDTAPPAGHLLPLLQLCDSALPTGGFSHSFGMESYLASGVVHDEATFAAWLRAYLTRQLVYCDGLAIRLAYGILDGAAVPGDPAPLWRLDGAVTAQALPAQVRTAGATMGTRMAEIGLLIVDDPLLGAYLTEIRAGRCAGHPALAYALAAHAVGAPAATAIEAYLFAAAASLTQNAVRGIPIGQNAGQRVQRGTHEPIAAAVAQILTLTEQDLGAVAPGLEIAQMRHQRQRARMFMS